MVETMYVEFEKGVYYEGNGYLGIDLGDMRTLAVPEDVPLWVCMECEESTLAVWACMECGKVNEMGSWRCEGCGKPLLTWLPGEGRWVVEHWAGSGWCDG